MVRKGIVSGKDVQRASEEIPKQKENPKLLIKECACCRKKFPVVTELVSADGRPYDEYGPYYLRAGDATIMQYGILCADCVETPWGERLKIFTVSDSFNSENEVI
jgi:hypothetical protein